MAPITARKQRGRRHCLAHVERVLQQAVGGGQLPKDTDTLLATQALHAYIGGIMNSWVLDPAALRPGALGAGAGRYVHGRASRGTAAHAGAACARRPTGSRRRADARRTVARQGIMRAVHRRCRAGRCRRSSESASSAPGRWATALRRRAPIAGVDVVMVDVAQAAVDRGVAAIGASLERLQKKDKITADARAAALARIRGTTDYAALGGSRSRHRGGDREPRAQASDPEAGRRAGDARHDPRIEHVVDLDHGARRRRQPPRAVPRHAFLQSGAADGAGRADSRPADIGCDGRRRCARSPSVSARRRSS